MIMKRLGSLVFDEAFQIMEKSFPEDERRPREEQAALLSDERYSLITYGRENKTEAFIALWDMGDFYFIEHFAVDSALRGCGAGSAILSDVLSSLDKPVCLEAEPPEDDIAIRRIGFYERHGFFYCDREYIQPSISRGRGAVPLKLMSCPVPLTEESFFSVRDTLYREVYHVSAD